VKDAVMNATPALLIKGSGQAACLMADAVVIKDYTTSTNQKTMLDEQQQKLLTFVEFMMFVFQIQSGKQGKFNYTKLIECLKESSRKLEIAVRTQLSSNNLASSAKWAKFREVFCFESTRIPMSERYVGEEARVSAPQSAMRVEREGAILVGQTYRMETSQFSVCELLCNVFQAANTGKCHVFDLHNTEPDAKSFKESQWHLRARRRNAAHIRQEGALRYSLGMRQDSARVAQAANVRKGGREGRGAQGVSHRGHCA
jgi:hypothetical protein